MKRRDVLGLLMGIGVAATGRDLAACGDKFLVASRSTRFQRAGFVRPNASVVLYATPSSRLATAVTALGLPGALSKVGYVPTVVSTPETLAETLRGGRVDLVVFDLADGAVARPGLDLAPAALAVAYEASGPELKEARRQFAGVVRRPGRATAVVDAVDDVMFDRAIRSSARSAGR